MAQGIKFEAPNVGRNSNDKFVSAFMTREKKVFYHQIEM